MASCSSNRISTFSIGVKEKDFNELPYARLVAEKYSTDHHEFIADADLLKLLPKLIWHMDEPIGEALLAPFSVLCRRAREDLTVVLSGEGADELL